MKRKYSISAPSNWEIDLEGKHGLPKYITQPIEELKCLLRDQYPDATFKLVQGLVYDIEGFHLYVYVDVNDMDDLKPVRDAVFDRVLEMQTEGDLPIWVHAEPLPERHSELAHKTWANRENAVK
jgi:hypothetical protein